MLERPNGQIEAKQAPARLDRDVVASFLSDSRLYMGLEHPAVAAGNGKLERRNEPRATY